MTKIELVRKLKMFFKEFNFNGATSIRFFNTLFNHAKTNSAYDYILNYFELIDSPYYEDVKAKMTSMEFKMLMEELSKIDIKIDQINQRLIILYGCQGTGKTTLAIKEYPNAKVMNCNSSMEPSDLLESFDFEGGNPVYTKTALFEAMINGEEIILDEMNLLTNDCLRFLQAFLDNKREFDYKGEKIKIKDGFGVIATMNLEVNGQRYPLPEPLVDRAVDLIKFEPDEELIVKYAFGE